MAPVEIEVVGIVDCGYVRRQLMVTIRVDGKLTQLFVPYEDTDFMNKLDSRPLLDDLGWPVSGLG
jgi:hypothetical protein